jgi:hypothetical protein
MAAKKSKGKVEIKEKGRKVLREFKAGKLRSSSGQKVTSKDQAFAIAASEQRRANRKK